MRIVFCLSNKIKEANMMSKLTFQREIEIRHNVDVLVVGGGPAGVAAAVTAARQGARVFLAEGSACLGGAGTTALVPAFMQFTDGVNFLAAGIGEEILNKMWQYGGKVDGWNYSIKVEALKRVYDDIVMEAGVDFALHTQMVDVIAADGKVEYVIFAAKSGMFAVKAKIYIDGTGDGDLCAWAGADFEKGDEDGRMMAGTLCSLWANINWDKVKKPDTRRLEDAFKDKVFTYEDRHLPGMWRVGETLGGGNIGHTFGVDATDERSLTKSLVWGRKSLVEYEKYYKEYLDGYENMELAATGAQLGIRESRRIMGDYVMVLDDFMNRADFEDEIGRYSYPVDIHGSDASKESFAKFEKEYYNLRYEKGESYGIPYRILTPKGLSNVLVAGRCVSCDRYIQSSIRVMPGCYITGQAAGAAAAIAVEKDTDTRGFDVGELQLRLKKLGAYLPNFKG
jgi:ribulose 1,5-bisphosphate synthetase/thiazole synthase